MTRALLMACWCAALMVTSVGAQPVLVQDGKALWSIYSPADASPAEKLAAAEIARYIEQMSGAQLPLVQELHGNNQVYVVNAHRLDRIGIPGNLVRIDDPEGYNVVAAANAIWVAGKTDRATLVAAYRFLDELGCRFLAPQYDHYQGSAEVIPKRSTITYTSGAIWARPALKYRKLYVEEGHSHDQRNLRQLIEWMPKVGYNILVVPTDYGGSGRVRWDHWRETITPEMRKRDLIIEVGGHGYQNFLNAQMEDGTLFEKHPEYFGQDAQGRRRRERAWAPCTSNPDAVAYLTRNFVQYVVDRPEIAIFDFWPPDGVRWCECETCHALGSPSDRQALLVNHVREEVIKIRPDLKMEAIAYQRLIFPAENVKLHEDVLVDFCPIRQNFEFTIFDQHAPAGSNNAEFVAGLKAWRAAFDGDISLYSYYRRYAWSSLPLVMPRFMQEELRFYRTIPVQGISIYSEPGDWFNYELNHYALPHLAWDIDLNIDELIAKFCDARYGPASREAQTLFDVMADDVRRYCSVPFVSLKDADEIASAQARISKAATALRDAKSRVDDPAIARSIDRRHLAVEYAVRDLAIQEARARNTDTASLRPMVQALHDFLQAHEDDGLFLIHRRLDMERLLPRYGVRQGD